VGSTKSGFTLGGNAYEELLVREVIDNVGRILVGADEVAISLAGRSPRKEEYQDGGEYNVPVCVGPDSVCHIRK
jgi:hypothetical protein